MTNQTTSTQIPTDPDTILEQVGPLCSFIYDSLLIGSQEARNHFDLHGHDVNRPLAANITRYHAKTSLQSSLGHGSGFLMEDLPSNGIGIVQDRYRLRVRKGRDGQPPTANNTDASRLYYKQSQPFLAGVDWESLPQNISTLNLILCWEVDASYALTNVRLFCPRESFKYRQGVRIHWWRSILHPVLALPTMQNVNESSSPDDLEVYFEDETGTQDLE